MSIVRFSDIQNIIIQIQTCRVHRPIVIGMYNHEYHINLNSNHEIENHACNQNIDNEYYISSISFESAHNKFRFACKKVSNFDENNENNENCIICGFKIGASIKSVLSEWEWYKTIRSKLNIKNKSLVPILFAIGYCHKLQRYGLILSVDGVSLDQIINKQPENIFNLETSMLIFDKSINCISYLHSMDIIHADIKYANLILMKNGNLGLIDFDSTVFYNKLSKNIINLDVNAFYPFRGTPLFTSIDAHQRKLLTKRSDLISLVFAVLYGYNHTLLPWNKMDDMDVMQMKKQKFLENLHEYLKDKELPKELLKVINYIINLKYHENPNYEYIQNVLQSWLQNIDRNLIQCGPKQIEFLGELKNECFKDYQCNRNQMDID